MHKHRFFRFLLIAIVTFVLPLARVSYAQTSAQPNLRQKITLYSKPAVVRVVAGCIGGYFYENDYHFYSYGGQGSGFFINPDGYIATRGIPKDEADCKERLFKRFTRDLAEKNISIANTKLTRDGIQEFSTFNFVVLPNEGDKREDQRIDFEVKVSSAPLGEGKDVAIIKIPSEGMAPALKLADSSKVDTLDEVTAIGYPANANPPEPVDTASKDNLFKRIQKAAIQFIGYGSSFEASVIEGKVSSPNKKMPDGLPILQLDMRTGGYGSAGSPILNAQGEVVGMLASEELDQKVFDLLDPNELEEFERSKDGQNGIPTAIQAATIQEFIKDSGAVNDQAQLDQYYRDGLDLYWQGKYAEAKAKFEAVQGLFPQHSEVDRLIQECNKELVDESFEPSTILWGAIAAVVALVLGLIFFLVRRPSGGAPKPSADVRPFARHSPTGLPKSNHSQAWLELEGMGETKKVPLYKDTHRIGRDPAWSDIEMPGSWEVLSRHHALLKREGNNYRIFDGDGRVPSRNGLLIDGYDKVDSTTGYLLSPGDTLTIGNNPAEQVRITYFNAAVSQVGKETKISS
jgi:hypothetical protein